MNLYEISQAIEEVINMVDEDGVLLPEAEQAFDALTMQKSEKFENIAKLIRNETANAEALKEEKAKLALKQKIAENKVERLKAYLKFVMEQAKQDKYQAGIFSFSLRESSSVEVSDPKLLPDEFKKVTVEPMKTEIKEAMKLGRNLDMVTIVKKQSLIIK